MRIRRWILLGTVLTFASGTIVLSTAAPAEAIPAFTRKFNTSCATCHVAYPKLNAFGEAFLRNGYRMPGGDEQYEADEPVKLGAEPWKRLWPNAIWPGSIPYLPPISFIVNADYVVEPDAEINNDFRFPSEFAFLTGGTFGDSISWFGRINLVAPGEDLHVHRLFGQFDGLLGTRMLNVRFGQMEPRAVPFSSNRRLTRFDYLLNSSTFPLGELVDAVLAHGAEDHDETDAHAEGGEHLHGGDYALGKTQQGVEVWGAADGFGGRGGLEYGFGIVNGNGSGDFAENGTNDNNSSKDIYWRAAYKFGGMSVLGNAETAPAQTDNWRDNSLRIGVFGYHGKAPYTFTGDLDDHEEEEEEHHEEILGSSIFTASEDDDHDDDHDEPTTFFVDEKFTRFGADASLWFGNLNLFGAFMWGETAMDPLLIHEAKAEFTSWFTEADYVFYPWLIGALRYERIDIPDLMDEDIQRWVPHVTALIRANVKFTFDAALYSKRRQNNRYLFNLSFAF